LGEAFAGSDASWHKHSDEEATRPNIERMTQRAKVLGDAMRERMSAGSPPSDTDRDLYENTVLYFLYNKYAHELFQYVQQAHAGEDTPSTVQNLYTQFQEDVVHYFAMPGTSFSLDEADHLFACFFQLRRAFHHIFDNIIGGSLAATRLRAAVWESIFTCNVHRYRRTLFARMGDVATLITGPSGTGKELVARAVGLSRYVPFDPQKKRFTVDFVKCFYPVNLSALSPTLIESELFGHT
ncbi:MAG: sigma-54 factor interaction domain-containing protein, partial [bacterium]|nr:sigma-54 factor interaction domain-containing protein [bacterium]